MFGASIPCGILLFCSCCFCCFFFISFFLFTGCWWESSVRGLSFFREVFVLFSFKFRSSFAPRRVASCPPTIQCLAFFLPGGGITVRVDIRCEIDVVLTCVFCKNQSFFVFLASDSISQPHGEGDFAIHYTIDTQLLVSLAPLFLFVYKCGYLRALTIYVWSEHSLWDFVVLQLLFLLFLLHFFFPFYWLLVGVFRKGFKLLP
jgi:hypothetical protein